MEKEELIRLVQKDTLKYEQGKWLLKKLHTSVNKIERYDPEQMCVFYEDYPVSTWIWVEIPREYEAEEWFQILIVRKCPSVIQYLKQIASEAVWRELIENSDDWSCASELRTRLDSPYVLLDYAQKGDDKALRFILRYAEWDRFQSIVVKLAKMNNRGALDAIYRAPHENLYFQYLKQLALVDKDPEAREFILKEYEDQRCRSCIVKMAENGLESAIEVVLKYENEYEEFQLAIVELAKLKNRDALDAVYREPQKELYFRCVEYLALECKDIEAREFILKKHGDQQYRNCIIKMAEDGLEPAVEIVLQYENDPDAKQCIENMIESGVIGSLKNNEIVCDFLLNNSEKWDEINKVGKLLSAMKLADKGDPVAKKCVCDYARKGELKAIDFVLSNLKDDDCWLCFASLAQMNENSKVAAKVLENKQYIMDFADEGDECARNIVLGSVQYTDIEKCHHALQWAIEEDPCAIRFILESSRNDLVEELAANGNIDALKILVMDGKLSAIELVAQMGDWDTIKESAKQGKINAIKVLLENERIKDIDEIIVAGGRNIIESINNLGCLEKIRDCTTSMLVKNYIDKYLRWLGLSVESGSVVELLDSQTGVKRKYCLDDKKRDDVSSDIQVIPPNSWVGEKLIGRRMGDVVRFYAFGRGMKEYKILKIS